MWPSKIGLIAGSPLEPYLLQHRFEIKSSVKVKKNMDWVISREAPNRRTFNDYSFGDYSQ